METGIDVKLIDSDSEQIKEEYGKLQADWNRLMGEHESILAEYSSLKL